LYYRLNTIPLHIPPLRKRKNEILEIAEAMIIENCKKYDFDVKTLSSEAKSELLAYNWPGNIRELLSVVERSVILSENNEIQKDELFLNARK